MLKTLTKFQWSGIVHSIPHTKLISSYTMMSEMVFKQSTIKKSKDIPSHDLKCKMAKQSVDSPQTDFLNKLLAQSRLQEYFGQRSVGQLRVEDIFFVMNNKQQFLELRKKDFQALISHPSLDCYSTFCIAEDLNALHFQRCQLKLLSNFNQASQTMSFKQFVHCIKIIGNFRKTLIEKFFNNKILQVRAKESDPQFQLDYLQLLEVVSQKLSLLEIIDKDDAKKRVYQLGKKLIQNLGSHNLPQLKYYYYLQVVQKALDMKPIQVDFDKRQKIVERKIKNAKAEEQLQYCIKLLSIYNQFTYLIRVQRLSSGLYIQYLNFLVKQKKNNSNFEPVFHEIPTKICQQGSSKQINKIIALRVDLGIDKINELGRLMKRLTSKKLQSANGLLKYIHHNRIENHQTMKDLLQNLSLKLKLKKKNYIREDIQKLLDQFDLIQVLQIMSFICSRNLSTSQFYKLCFKFLSLIISQQDLLKDLRGIDQNKFIIYAFQIYGMNTIPQVIENRLVNLSLIALANNSWSTTLILRLSKILNHSKFGNNYIWYAMEKKIIQVYNGKQQDQVSNENLKKTMQKFMQMRVGSQKFFSIMRKVNTDQSTYQNIQKMSKLSQNKDNQMIK